jgi:DNA-binding winged helix-turn-helix (wHTH) protein/TolB-like protein
MSNAVRHVYEFGSFVLNPEQQLLTRNGRSVPITPKAFETLVLLVERRGELIDKKELMRTIWPDSFVEEGNLCVAISLLRKTLGEDDQHRYIKTVPKRGYRFVAEVTELSEPARQTIHTFESPAPEFPGQQDSETVKVVAETLLQGRSIPFSWRLGPGKVTTISGFSILMAVFFWWFTRQPEVHATKAVPITSLAVLPFQTQRANANDEYLGLGLADAIITKLGSTGKIVMRSTRAVQKYINTSQDPRSVGRELGVDAVLDGQIQRENDRVRLTVQLIRVVDGVHL